MSHVYRHALVCVLVGSVGLIGCGGSSSSTSASTNVADPSAGGSSESTVAKNKATSATSAGGGGVAAIADSLGTIKVKVINLASKSDGTSAVLDVYVGFVDPAMGALPKPNKAAVPFGSIAELDVPISKSTKAADVSVSVAGSKENKDWISGVGVTAEPGERFVFTLTFSKNNDAESLSFQSSNEVPKDVPGAPALDVAVPGKAVIIASSRALELMLADKNSFQLGSPGKGCLTHAIAGDTINVGGTSLVPYVADPGAVTVALFPSEDITCEGTPASAAFSFDAAAGSRTMVLAYGTAADAIKFISVPLAS